MISLLSLFLSVISDVSAHRPIPNTDLLATNTSELNNAYNPSHLYFFSLSFFTLVFYCLKFKEWLWHHLSWPQFPVCIQGSPSDFIVSSFVSLPKHNLYWETSLSVNPYLQLKAQFEAHTPLKHEADLHGLLLASLALESTVIVLLCFKLKCITKKWNKPLRGWGCKMRMISSQLGMVSISTRQAACPFPKWDGAGPGTNDFSFSRMVVNRLAFSFTVKPQYYRSLVAITNSRCSWWWWK